MPKLTDTRKILKLPIKSIEGSEVTVRDGLLGTDAVVAFGNGKMNDAERPLNVLSKMITDWNLTDDDGKKLPVTLENLKKLNILDIADLISATSLGDEDKKKQM